MKTRKFYTVWEGRNPGVFDSWEMCKQQVDGFEGAKYKSFESEQAAKQAFEDKPGKHLYAKKPTAAKQTSLAVAPPIRQSVVVDAAWNSVSKDMEYQGFDYATGNKLFSKGPFPDATNNIGEFLAIVHALALLHQRNADLPIYSDSRTAISWVRNKRANTKLAPTDRNAEVFDLIARAENWLKNHSYRNKILKWETEYWGENPADFGRK